MRYWLMKSEPDTFGIADLERVKVEPWTGVRSYFARAHMRAMSVGDQVLFHHSNDKPPGVAGLARVVRTGVIDETQFDPDGKYFEPKATRDAPIWDCVEVEYVETLPHFVTMDRIRAEPALAQMLLLRQGRLSVQPVTEAEYEVIVALGHTAPPEMVKPAKRAAVATPARAKPRPSMRGAGRAAARPAKRPGAATGARAVRAAKAAKAAQAAKARPARPVGKPGKRRSI